MKESILIVYPKMMLGGSTTSLLAFLNSIDENKYNVDLLMYKNEGELLDYIPPHINVLQEAYTCNRKFGKIKKIIRFIFSRYLFKSLLQNDHKKRAFFSEQVLAEFQAKKLSRKLTKLYDYAIGFLEGWSDRYVAFSVKSEKKYGWIHSTFHNIANIPKLEYTWMNEVDKIVFVSNECCKDFIVSTARFKEKAIVIDNILDSNFIRKRSAINYEDIDYLMLTEKKKFKIITVCRLAIETKGLDRIISCALKLKNAGYDFIWYIVGDGEDRTQLETLIDNNFLQDFVVLLGMKANPYPFIRECDLMCMPSRWEGKPMAVTESKILGTPTLVTNYLSAVEQIQNGKEGFVVENDDDSIYPVIKMLMDDTNIIENIKSNLLSNDYGNLEYMRCIEKKLFNKNNDLEETNVAK